MLKSEQIDIKNHDKWTLSMNYVRYFFRPLIEWSPGRVSVTQTNP